MTLLCSLTAAVFVVGSLLLLTTVVVLLSTLLRGWAAVAGAAAGTAQGIAVAVDELKKN